MKLQEQLAEGAHLFQTKGDLLMLAEAYVDISKLEDGDLRVARKGFLKFYSKEFSAFQELGDNRYATPEGVLARRNMDYYDGLIRRVEYEMSCRMIPLS